MVDPTLAGRAFGETQAPAVALGTFSAVSLGDGARVEWTTAEETAIDRFLVEGRPDAFGQPFMRWGEVAADGSPSAYRFDLPEAPDGGPLPPGPYRVRLLAVAAGDVFDLGDVGLEVDAPTATEHVVDPATLFPPTPNPAAGGLVRVHLRLARPAPILAVLYDALGREVAVVHDGPAAGRLELAVDTTHLAPGPYVLRVAALDGSAARSRSFTVAR